MALISRITKLENSLPEPKEPMPDLSQFSNEELYFLRDNIERENIPPNEESRLKAIIQKISWKAGCPYGFKNSVGKGGI